jgi:hypothetical protein
MKIRMPNLNGFGAPTKSSTFRNLDSVFAAISFLANYCGLKNVNPFLSALNTSFQRITYMVSVNPTLTIAELKRIRLAYITWIRGGEEVPLSPEAANEEPEHVTIGAKGSASESGLSFAAEEYLLGTICISSLLELRKILVLKGTSHESLRFYDMLVVAFLDLNRVINMPAVWNFETITAPPVSSYHTEIASNAKAIEERAEASKRGSSPPLLEEHKIKHNLENHITTLLTSMGLSLNGIRLSYKGFCRSQKFYIINSAGPNGEATWTAYSDAIAILRNKPVLEAMIKFCNLSGLKRFLKKLTRVVQLRAVDGVPFESLKLGKLITFAEWGGKTRTVAAVDYWTQIILTPLHETLYEALRALETDTTFDQRAGAEKVRQWTEDPKSELYSFDLTAATDRLPRILQSRILNKLLGLEGIGEAWANILALREYHSENGNAYTYSCGLPMGSKSNWAMLAFTHHLIVMRAAEIAKVSNFRGYRICGDDIVINSTKVAKEYRMLMEYYGLSINEQKSILHLEKHTPAAEFCKRIFVGGVEYTCLPTKLISKTVMNGRLLPQLQNEVLTRNFELSSTKLFTWLGALVDPQSHSFLALLNRLPLSITGLVSKVELPLETPQLSQFWEPEYTLSENDIVQGYTYVAAVEQLKRLDSLLRQTKTVNDAIASAMASNYNLNLNMFEWAKEVGNAQLVNTIKSYMTDLSVAHPIVEAAQAEAIRVSLLLTKLSNGDMTVESAARGKVLDMFRNSLTSMWQDTEAARAQADRTLIVRVLDHLETMITTPVVKVVGEEERRSYIASFSTKLAHLERNWMVRWQLGSNVTINTMKTKVETSVETATSSASNNALKLPIRRKIRT